METRKYLKTVEDVLTLKDTNIKIYEEPSAGYYKFVKGILCHFNAYNGITYFNCSLDMEENLYILEESVKEASEKDVGKLCWAYNEFNEEKDLGILKEYDTSDGDKYHLIGLGWYYHCRPLTKEEIKEFMEKA